MNYSQHAIFEKSIATLLCIVLYAEATYSLCAVYQCKYTLHCNLHSITLYHSQISVFKSMRVRGFTVAGKGCSELKSIFVSVWRGLTCIQVELYESEGQSYELCRSEKRILLTTKKKKKKQTPQAQLHCSSSATQTPQEQK